MSHEKENVQPTSKQQFANNISKFFTAADNFKLVKKIATVPVQNSAVTDNQGVTKKKTGNRNKANIQSPSLKKKHLANEKTNPLSSPEEETAISETVNKNVLQSKSETNVAGKKSKCVTFLEKVERRLFNMLPPEPAMLQEDVFKDLEDDALDDDYIIDESDVQYQMHMDARKNKDLNAFQNKQYLADNYPQYTFEVVKLTENGRQVRPLSKYHSAQTRQQISVLMSSSSEELQSEELTQQPSVEGQNSMDISANEIDGEAGNTNAANEGVFYNSTQVNVITTYIRALEVMDADYSLALAKATSIMHETNLELVDIDEFHVAPFRTRLTAEAILPGFSSLLRAIKAANDFDDLWGRIERQATKLASVDANPDIIPKTVYDDDLSLVCAIAKMARGSNSNKAKRIMLAKMKGSIEKKILRKFNLLEREIFGAEVQDKYYDALREAKKAKKNENDDSLQQQNNEEETDDNNEIDENILLESPAKKIPEEALESSDDETGEDEEGSNTDESSDDDSEQRDTYTLTRRRLSKARSSEVNTLNLNEYTAIRAEHNRPTITMGAVLHGGHDFVSYIDAKNKVNLLVTEHSVLSLALPRTKTPKPTHIACVIGIAPDVVLSICYLIEVTQCTGIFEKLRSVTLLVPSEFSRNPNRQAGYVETIWTSFHNSGCSWNATFVDFSYSSNDKRKLLIITRLLPQSIQCGLIKNEELTAVHKAYAKASEQFNLPGGVHALPFDAVNTLLDTIKIQPGDCSWDIGCGNNQLSSSLSCASVGGVVVCTDIGEVYRMIRLICENSHPSNGEVVQKRLLRSSTSSSSHVNTSSSRNTREREDCTSDDDYHANVAKKKMRVIAADDDDDDDDDNDDDEEELYV